MEFSSWLKDNHYDLLEGTRSYVKNNDEADELYQCVVEQLLTKPDRINEVPDNQKKYFFIRTIKNNYQSKTSPYHYKIRKHNTRHTPLIESITEDIIDEPYEESIPDIEWVKTQLNEFEWFERDLFLLFIELGTLTNVARQTQIPLNSVGRYINKTKQKLKEKWDTSERID